MVGTTIGDPMNANAYKARERHGLSESSVSNNIPKLYKYAAIEYPPINIEINNSIRFNVVN